MSKQKVSLKVELKKKSWNYANFCDKKSTNLLHYTILTTKRKEDFDKVAGCLITGEFVKQSGWVLLLTVLCSETTVTICDRLEV